MNTTRSSHLNTLVIDIGGTYIKLMILNHQKLALTTCSKVATPHPANVAGVLQAIKDVLKGVDQHFDRISVGFPGVVEHGVIKSAPNMCSSWIDLPFALEISTQFNVPTKVINDADLLGVGLVRGLGVELVITLGTGMGSALFTSGHLVPNLELAHHPFDNDRTYEQLLGKHALEELGVAVWNEKLLHAITFWKQTFNYQRLYLAGGNTANIDIDLPTAVTVVNQIDGLRGGVELWERS